MRVAFFVGRFPALSETFVLNQVTGLIDRGCEVDIYPLHGPGESRHHPDVARYRLLERVHPQRTFGARLLRAPGQILRGLPRAPVACLRALDVFRLGRDAAYLRIFHQVAPLLERRPYDAAVCHFGSVAVSALRLKELGALTGKFVSVFHGHDLSQYLRIHGEGAYDRLFAGGDLFLPVSERWKRRLLELGCPAGRLAVHRMGIDPDRFSFRHRLPPEDGPVRLLSVGRLVEKKGFEFGIRAVAELLRREPARKLEYTILGYGPLRESLEATIHALGVQDVVRLGGSVTQDEVLAAMRAAHVLLAPSAMGCTGDEEGVPVVLMEAMATGLPVVSTSHSGIPELVQDGVSGRLVPERDVEAMVDALQSLLDQPESWSRLGHAGRRRVEADFNIHKLNDRLVELLAPSPRPVRVGPVPELHVPARTA
jgi:colanic acid/amylovoran biosynthesis glycosyltransferase